MILPLHSPTPPSSRASCSALQPCVKERQRGVQTAPACSDQRRVLIGSAVPVPADRRRCKHDSLPLSLWTEVNWAELPSLSLRRTIQENLLPDFFFFFTSARLSQHPPLLPPAHTNSHQSLRVCTDTQEHFEVLLSCWQGLTPQSHKRVFGGGGGCCDTSDSQVSHRMSGSRTHLQVHSLRNAYRPPPFKPGFYLQDHLMLKHVAELVLLWVCSANDSQPPPQQSGAQELKLTEWKCFGFD